MYKFTSEVIHGFHSMRKFYQLILHYLAYWHLCRSIEREYLCYKTRNLHVNEFNQLKPEEEIKRYTCQKRRQTYKTKILGKMYLIVSSQDRSYVDVLFCNMTWDCLQKFYFSLSHNHMFKYLLSISPFYVSFHLTLLIGHRGWVV